MSGLHVWHLPGDPRDSAGGAGGGASALASRGEDLQGPEAGCWRELLPLPKDFPAALVPSAGTRGGKGSPGEMSVMAESRMLRNLGVSSGEEVRGKCSKGGLPSSQL